MVLNNLLVMALAADLTHEAKYADGVAMGMDYLLGRNPLDQSYVTGYGSRPLLHPHHRFFAQQKDPRFPPPPPGFLSGGPNSMLQDITVKMQAEGCSPERCWVDHIEAYSVNEVAVNWNAPLAWVAAWLDEAGASPNP
jgi:endoglucanase